MGNILDLDYLNHTQKFIISEEMEGILDAHNYSIAFLDTQENIVYMNRNFLQRYLHSYHINNYSKQLPLKELNHNLWLNIYNSYKTLYNKNGTVIQLFNNNKLFIGYLFIEKEKKTNYLSFDISSIENIFSKDIYEGLYLADSNANTIKTNISYERISLLPEIEVKGRNLKELEERGYFSRSVTLLVLERLKLENNRDKISIRQKIVTGKEALVTGIPIFSKNSKIEYIVTVVKEIIPIVDIRNKLESLNKKKLWNGFSKTENGKYVIKFDNNFIIAEDKKTKNIIEVAEKASQSSLPILLKGETGTGKDLLAKYIHYLKCKQDKGKPPFIMINCSAFPKELLETEIFGYEAGAFSGAKKEGKKGLIELANDGILFLNEIGELPLNLQAKFLTVLDNGVVRKIGGTREFKVNFQLISATNKDIEESVKQGKFREDLYYRINAISIDIPPLRNRKNDILPIMFFLVHELQKDKKTFEKKFLSSAILDIFVNYEWPGNIRELIHTIKNIYALSNGKVITINDLPANMLKIIFNSSINNNTTISLRDSVKQYEIELIKETVQKLGSLTKAAKALKVDVSTLRRKLKND